MAKSPDSIKKVCGVKKVNKMSNEVCLKELARLESMKDFNSRYQQEIRERLNILKEAALAKQAKKTEKFGKAVT